MIITFNQLFHVRFFFAIPNLLDNAFIRYFTLNCKGEVYVHCTLFDIYSAPLDADLIYRSLTVGFRLLRYSVVCTVESLLPLFYLGDDASIL